VNKIILFELNEVPQKIVEYYILTQPNSWLAKNYAVLKKFNSYTENPGQLNPWNTWPTLHRGVDSSQHGILDLNQNLEQQNKNFPAIWQVLAENKISTGVFGSLHSYPLPIKLSDYAFYVPDVFAQSPECWPKKVETFQEINLGLSRKSARNVSRQVPKKALINLALKAPSLGIKTSTIKNIGQHLLQERKEAWKSTRRRTIQSAISFDIFFKLLKQKKPAFTSFYTNHVAACLHRYWAAAFPTAFEINQYPQEWIERYDQEILYALNKADKMMEALAGFVNRHPEYKLIILSSMGQDAVKARPIYTQLYITDHQKFIQNFGVTDAIKSIPAMLPQFNLKLNEVQLKTFTENAKKTFINGKPLRFRTHDEGHISIEMGHINQSEINFKIGENLIKPELSGLENVAIADQSSTTADHIPEGIFYTYHPSFKSSIKADTVLETCTIFPTLLNNFGLTAPDYANKSNPLVL
jgi:hypothetical protein